MKEPPTRNLRLADGTAVLLDEEDFWRFWDKHLFVANRYVCFRDADNRMRRLHREVMDVRDQRIVMHLDGNTRNCTRTNLHVQSRGVFGRARPGQGASKFKGVSPYRGRWQATIRVDGKLRWLGSFDTAEDAARAYDDAVLEYRGRDGLLNFPTRPRRRKRPDAATE